MPERHGTLHKLNQFQLMFLSISLCLQSQPQLLKLLEGAAGAPSRRTGIEGLRSEHEAVTAQVAALEQAMKSFQ